MPEQLGFDLPVRTALGREDFLVSPANAVALAMIEGWQTWPQGKMVLSGPEGAGKTHLTHVWAQLTNAQIVAAKDLLHADIEGLAQGALAVENVPEIQSDSQAQTQLFHLHNLLMAAEHPLLMTGRTAPGFWSMALPDLQSRVDASGHAALEAPDDALLAAVLAKLFADRQLRPRADVVPYLVTRMERSFAAAGRIVAHLDAQSLAKGQKITRAFTAKSLDTLP